MIRDKKSSVLYVLEILQNYTDVKHSLNYAQIIEKLKNIYDITLERKTIARDIDILMDKGYEIVKRGNYGVYLGTRGFEEGELLYLIDAIYSSKSIPTKYAKDIIEKLTADCSLYSKKKFKYLEKMDELNRTDNKQLFLTIEVLNDAIEQGKKVEFQYNDYGLNKEFKPMEEGKKYIINPYYMVNNNGKYYLVCNLDKYEDLSNYKIENISNIKILPTDVKPIKSLPDQENFSIKQYMNEHIYMMSGNSVVATMKILDKKRISDVISWFGRNILIKQTNGEIYVTVKVNENALIYWAMQYGEYVEIVSPIETKNKMINLLKNMLTRYNNSLVKEDNIMINKNVNKEELINFDNLLPDAIEFAIVSKQISIPLLQRKFKIGFARGAKLIDKMEEVGFISKFEKNNPKPRDIIITSEEYEKIFHNKVDYSITKKQKDNEKNINYPLCISTSKTDELIELELKAEEDFNKIEFYDEDRNKLNKEEQGKVKLEFTNCYKDSEQTVIGADIEDLQKFVKEKNYCLSYKNFNLYDNKALKTTIEKINTNSAFIFIEATPDLELEFISLSLDCFKSKELFFSVKLFEKEEKEGIVKVFF